MSSPRNAVGSDAIKIELQQSSAASRITTRWSGGARRPIKRVFNGLWNFANWNAHLRAARRIEVNPVTGAAPTSAATFIALFPRVVYLNYGVFIQNDWKVRPKISRWNLGLRLRWEYYAPPTEAAADHLVNFEPTNDPVNGLADGRATNPQPDVEPDLA